MTEDFNPNAVRNPSSGLFGRNPTHQEIAAEADDPSEIVKAIKQSGVKRIRVTNDYSDMDPLHPPPMSGITKIRDMSEEEIQDYCKTLMRSRPNIFKIDIKLGNYPNQHRINNQRTQMLNSNKPRFHTELGEKIGTILADRNLFVTQIVYTVHNAEPGYFNATAEVYSTSKEEYDNDKLFKPSITYEYVKTT